MKMQFRTFILAIAVMALLGTAFAAFELKPVDENLITDDNKPMMQSYKRFEKDTDYDKLPEDVSGKPK